MFRAGSSSDGPPVVTPSSVRAKPRQTIGRKLNRLVVSSVGIALLFGALLSSWSQAQNFLHTQRAVMIATASVFASATSKAVADGNVMAINEATRAITRVPGFIFLGVRDREGKLLADMGSGARLTADIVMTADAEVSPLALLSSRTLTVRLPVIDGGEPVGEIELVADADGLAGQFAVVLVSALLGSAAALAIGLTLAMRLRRSITRPIEQLAAAMVEIERTGNRRSIAGIDSDDETGVLAERFDSMLAEIRASTDRILAREQEIIERLGRAGEMRDDQTGQHVGRVARISRIIATELGLPDAYVDDLCRASPMHDVGKVSIPDQILHKPGRLDPEERRAMEEHARRGYEILQGSSSPLVQLAAEIAISHHERWDGAGYPNRIAGAEIPLSGRITAVADVCDALLSERPYKQPWSLQEVRDFLAREAGAHFDPDCVRALTARWPELEAIYVPSSTSQAA